MKIGFSGFTTRFLAICAAVSFLSAETGIFILWGNLLKRNPTIALPNVYLVGIMFLFPALIGFRGYAIARKCLFGIVDQEMAVKLLLHFLFGIIVTYGAITFTVLDFLNR